ncbi:MAG TPA: adenylate/guanylate cyclase domain-containing protein [Verrucomicrobiota bacterium]|nr:MAG: Adenylate cyclase 2 [Verrucomicrobia bacterium ADurb.Bin118]HPY31006.1 adenylate/guanylate cyclase domain-containing protein [Verrucomicrobiota bacterium]HQB17381.1 adenylate/guanylate cyclase domain-containing protein [Verrucomicrobiota bacterium]
MRRRLTCLFPVLIAAGVATLLIGAAAGRLELVERIEAITFDWRVRLAQHQASAPAESLGFVYINDATIDALKNRSLGFSYGLYWPRHIYGRVLRELERQGARAVAFDVLFGELREDHAPVQFAGQPPIESDEFFAQQIRAAGNVILAADRGILPPPLLATNAYALGDISAEKDPDGVLRRARAFQLYRQWHPLFLQAEAEYGVNLAEARIEPNRILLSLPDGSSLPVQLDEHGNFSVADFIGDNLPPGMPARAKPFTDQRVWHMGIVLAARALQLDLAKATVDLADGRITLPSNDGAQRVIPVDREGYFFIDWSLKAFDSRMTAQNFADLLRRDRDWARGQTNDIPALWKEKLVVIGSTATGNDLTDLGATPLEKETFLLSKHWNVAHAILNNRFIRRLTLAEEIAGLILLGALATGLTLWLRSPWSSLAVTTAGVVYLGLAVWVYLAARWWLPLVLPLVGGLALTHGSVLAYQAFFEQREKRHIKSVFSKLVSPNVVNELLRSQNLSLSGARREVTVFFADVRGFTALTDQSQERAEQYVREHQLTGEAAEACYANQAGEILATVNLYLAQVADMVIKHDGTLDKYIGDCVMAFWGAPTFSPHHARACVRAAVDAQRAIHELNQRRQAENQAREAENIRRASRGQPPLPLRPLLALGTGINTGVVTVGLMGSEQHLRNYTVFGREVNLASRLEGISGRGRIVISEATYRHLERDAPALAATCVALPPVAVKGIRAAVSVYEVPWQQPA